MLQELNLRYHSGILIIVMVVVAITGGMFTSSSHKRTALHPKAFSPSAFAEIDMPTIVNVSLLMHVEEDETTTAALQALASDVLAGCSSHGFMYVTGHGVDAALQQRVFEIADRYFNQDASVKARDPIVAGQGFTRGYVGLGKESGSDQLEVKEGFSYGYEWPEGVTEFENPLQGRNVWPACITLEERTDLIEYYNQFTKAAKLITKALALAVTGDPHAYDAHLTEAEKLSLFRIFKYFPYDRADAKDKTDASQTRIGSSEHTDWGFVTAIAQNVMEGLQVFHKGQWMTVPVVPGSIVVNVGDYLALATRGKLHSPLHRVVTGDRVRMSLVLFLYPNFDTKMLQVQQEEQEEVVELASLSLLQNQHKNGMQEGVVAQRESLGDMSFGEYILDKWVQVQRDD